jgi:dihydrofolate reductase
MRKLKLQMQVSVDGFVGREDGGLDWMTWNWDDGLKNYVHDLHMPVDCILLGRKMTDGFINAWTKMAKDPATSDWFSNKMVDTPKVVFTKTLEKSEWENTVLAKGNLADEINFLKKQSGKDIIVYGGSTFVTSLIKENLIDEYFLFVNPAAIGKGFTIFTGVENKLDLKLTESKAFDCGIVVLRYEVK